jgi:hypothetical protein
MRLTTSNRPRVWLILGVVGAVSAIGVVAAAASTPSRSALMNQLERPATYAPASLGSAARAQVNLGPGEIRSQLRVDAQAVALRITPNRASERDRLSLAITKHGRPLDGADVTVAFSMPAMNTWQLLTSHLAPAGNGTYTGTEPILGMPGIWQLRLQVTPSTAPAFGLTIDDRMGR